MILFKTVRCHGNSWIFRISKLFSSVVEKLNFAQLTIYTDEKALIRAKNTLEP